MITAAVLLAGYIQITRAEEVCGVSWMSTLADYNATYVNVTEIAAQLGVTADDKYNYVSFTSTDELCDRAHNVYGQLNKLRMATNTKASSLTSDSMARTLALSHVVQPLAPSTTIDYRYMDDGSRQLLDINWDDVGTLNESDLAKRRTDYCYYRRDAEVDKRWICSNWSKLTRSIAHEVSREAVFLLSDYLQDQAFSGWIVQESPRHIEYNGVFVSWSTAGRFTFNNAGQLVNQMAYEMWSGQNVNMRLSAIMKGMIAENRKRDVNLAMCVSNRATGCAN